MIIHTLGFLSFLISSRLTSFSSLTLVTHTARGVKLLAVCTLNDVMSAGLTSRLTGQHADQRLLLRSSIFLLTCLTVTLPVARAEKYIGCLLDPDVCDQHENCFDDYAFGRCVSPYDAYDGDYYTFGDFDPEVVTFLEDEVTRLYENGYTWTDDYTQCVLQTSLAAIRDQIDVDIGLCDLKENEDLPEMPEFQDTTQQDEETVLPAAASSEDDDYLILSEPILLQPEDNLIDVDTRNDWEEPIELQGLPQEQDLQRTKYYIDDAKDYPEETLNTQPQIDYIDYDYPTEEDLAENNEETFDDIDRQDSVFYRKNRMDVKKPGPFVESSPNNFYLDKLTYDRYDTDEDETNKNESKEQGQVEYEIPMPQPAPAKEKRMLIPEESILENSENDLNDYVHIALNNKFQEWREGSDFINALAWELGLPEDALTDRTIENQHVQFKVDPNPQNVDAAKVAEVLGEDINLKKRLTDTLGVDVANVAASNKADRSSVFPEGNNLNLLILVVVGASATASLLVGGLVFALARRTKACQAKKVNKLQLSDDVEDRGKLQEEYKQLCRDWSKTKQSPTASINSEHKGKPMSTSVTKVQSQNSKESNGSNRSSTSSWCDEPVHNSMDISTGHMVLAYMEDHLKNKQRLEQEWVALCGYEAEPNSTVVAFKAENKKKNRYPDKLPYDHNRVILNALVNASSSDYINASTVTDHDPRNPSYVVTQGPLGQTVADFWQMIWEQGCVVIVMLSRLQDNGYQLCTRYWPEEGSEQYHIFEVHLVSEHVWCEDYLVRSVYLKNTRTGETRTVTQFHFRSWPAHGVPSSTKALLEFRRKVNKSYRGRSCPIVVHCSDGVGRAGTYVLIDMVLNRLSKGCKEIDIAATLEHIRDQRGGMVQNRQQFEFCLMAVAEEVHAILKALPQ